METSRITPPSFWESLYTTDNSPEGTLIRYVAATAGLLSCAALFWHTPLPLLPAGVLLYGLRAYHARTVDRRTARTTPLEGAPGCEIAEK